LAIAKAEIGSKDEARAVLSDLREDGEPGFVLWALDVMNSRMLLSDADEEDLNLWKQALQHLLTSSEDPQERTRAQRHLVGFEAKAALDEAKYFQQVGRIAESISKLEAFLPDGPYANTNFRNGAYVTYALALAQWGERSQARSVLATLRDE